VLAGYQEAKAKYELAEQQYHVVNEGAREEEIQAAEAALQQAKAALRLAEANREQVAVREGDVAAANAAIRQAEGALQSARSAEEQAKAARQEAEAYVSYTELLAPVDGVILSQNARAGELISAGYPVFTIQSASDVPWAKFYLPETDIVGLKAGDTVELKLLATGQTLEGSVRSVAAAPDYAVKKATQNLGDADVRSFSVKVELSGLPEGAAAGMTLEWIGRGGSE
jgi:HlyD family secretion protein